MKRSTSPEKNSSIKKIKSEREENWDKLSWEQNSPIKQIKSEREVYNENDLSFELHQLYSDAEACSIFRKLENEISYLDRDKAKIKIFGKEHRMPRSVAAYGDDNLSYTYSNFKMYAEPWTQTLKEIKKDVENVTGSEYNFVLINRYQNGKDHMGAHKDDEKDLVKDYSIASVSLGQSRDFTFSRKSFPSVKITLENGSLLEMKHPTNTYWYHCLPRCEAEKPRINLTFRRMNPQKQNSPIKKIKSECKMFCESDLSFEQNSTVKKLKSEHEVYCKNDLSYELCQLYSDAEACSIFRKLENEISYLDRDKAKIKIFGKEHRMPRSVAAYGDDNLSYTYSNFKMYAEPWTQTLKEIKKDVENVTGSEYNFVLINRYQNGKDHMGAHKDDEKDLVKDYSIASVSLGQSRDFTFSRKSFPSVKITLENGSLLEMKHPTNTYWYHCLPRCEAEKPRINLTFRRMNPQKQNSPIKKIKSECKMFCESDLSFEQNSTVKKLKSEHEVYCKNDLSYELCQLYSDAKAYSIFRKLENEISYLDRDKAKIKIFGKEYRMPRSVAAYGDDNLSYKYSNFRMYAEPWTQTLKEIKKDVENATGSEYNFVLINKYENGKDHMGAHKDDEKDLVKDYSIASVSLGQSRAFTFSRKNFPSVKITLENGSLLEMKHPTNTFWYHCLPRCKVENPRINLTFRRMNPQEARK